MSTVKNIQKAYEMTVGSERRSRGCYAVNADGDQVSPVCSNARRFCVVGALVRVQHGVIEHEQHKSRTTLKRQEAKLVNETLNSPEYGCLIEAARYLGWPSVIDFSDVATDDKFDLLFSTAISIAHAEGT